MAKYTMRKFKLVKGKKVYISKPMTIFGSSPKEALMNKEKKKDPFSIFDITRI